MITDAIVEEAAIKAYTAPDIFHDVMSLESWHNGPESTRANYRCEARAVLEYAATRGPTREDRLVQYRCAIAAGPFRCASTNEKAAATIEDRAHAMLAAERPAEAPAADEATLSADLIATLQKNKALLLGGIADAVRHIEAGRRDAAIDLLDSLLPKEAP